MAKPTSWCGWRARARSVPALFDGHRSCGTRWRRVARLRPTGQGDRVQVLWWRREAWGNPGPFGREVMPLNEALEFIASEGFFWISAS